MTKRLFGFTLSLLAAGLTLVTFGAAVPVVTVDELGNGSITLDNTILNGQLMQDPSGGVPATTGVLVYTLPAGFDPWLSGDVQITEQDGTTRSDVVRFFNNGNGGNFLIFYSLLGEADNPPGGRDGIADIPANLFNAVWNNPLPNISAALEVNGTVNYAPVPGSGPGYVGGGGWNGAGSPDYVFISDVVPEPSSLLMFGAMLVSALVLRNRR